MNWLSMSRIGDPRLLCCVIFLFETYSRLCWTDLHTGAEMRLRTRLTRSTFHDQRLCGSAFSTDCFGRLKHARALCSRMVPSCPAGAILETKRLRKCRYNESQPGTCTNAPFLSSHHN
ncbi:hypothetical protein DFH11DRAFT_1643169 [Phellopilus nigrolimitatus]|nr:hypothetical protein DFH11DRAFT_1643169 [Phellopilus nigrolimitatus]